MPKKNAYAAHVAAMPDDEFAKLVVESVKRPADAPDDGTCGLPMCVCGVCWVKRAQQPKTAMK